MKTLFFQLLAVNAIYYLQNGFKEKRCNQHMCAFVELVKVRNWIVFRDFLSRTMSRTIFFTWADLDWTVWTTTKIPFKWLSSQKVSIWVYRWFLSVHMTGFWFIQKFIWSEIRSIKDVKPFADLMTRSGRVTYLFR